MFDTSRCRVADMRFSEVARDLVGLALCAPEETAHVTHQLGRAAGSLASHRVGFEVLIEQLIGIELGAVAGQEEEPQPSFLPFHPACDIPRAVDWVTVHDHEDLPASLPFQASQEEEEDARCEPGVLPRRP